MAPALQEWGNCSGVKQVMKDERSGKQQVMKGEAIRCGSKHTWSSQFLTQRVDDVGNPFSEDSP